MLPKHFSYFLGKEKFIQAMNQKAQNLGMKNTFYADPTGLSPENKSTAQDLAKLLTYIYQKILKF